MARTEPRPFFIFLILFTIIGCTESKAQTVYLQKVLSNLEKIESATYYAVSEPWQPGDTAALFVTRRLIKEYDNPADSTIGASFIWLNYTDGAKPEFCYDGKIKVQIQHKKKEVVVNDFSLNKLPFRPISPPFFCYAKNIIRYALTTGDSIATDLQDVGDHYYFKLTIHEDRQVEFFGKAHYMPVNPHSLADPTSVYELWISKSDDLPYKLRREMSHNISVTTCSNVEINKETDNGFNAQDYFPAGYEIKKYGERKSVASAPDITGKKAPEWTLQDVNGQPVSLAGLTGKVVLINFTGIGCGPCQASIPFLKELRNSFSIEDLEMIAIESWVRKAHSLQNYTDKNGLNYTMVSATDEVIESYQTGGMAPVFIILDKERIVRKVFKGYSQQTTAQEVRSAISGLLLP